MGDDHRGWADADLLRGWARDLGLRTPTRRPSAVAGLGPREAVETAIEEWADRWLHWQFALGRRELSRGALVRWLRADAARHATVGPHCRAVVAAPGAGAPAGDCRCLTGPDRGRRERLTAHGLDVTAAYWLCELERAGVAVTACDGDGFRLIIEADARGPVMHVRGEPAAGRRYAVAVARAVAELTLDGAERRNMPLRRSDQLASMAASLNESGRLPAKTRPDFRWCGPREPEVTAEEIDRCGDVEIGRLTPP